MQGVHLSRVLRIDNVPAGLCTVACRGCDFDPEPTVTRGRFYADPERAAAQVVTKVEQLDVDLIAIRPRGEATLDQRLGALLTALGPIPRPVVVFTNGTTLHRDDVRRELALADAVCLEVGLHDRRNGQANVVVDGIRVFSSAFKRPIFTVTSVVADTPGFLLEVEADFAGALKPAVAYLAPRGETDADLLARAERRFAERVPRVVVGAPEAGFVETLTLARTPSLHKGSTDTPVHAVA